MANSDNLFYVMWFILSSHVLWTMISSEKLDSVKNKQIYLCSLRFDVITVCGFYVEEHFVVSSF